MRYRHVIKFSELIAYGPDGRKYAPRFIWGNRIG
jgi:hypothetical protein